MNCAQKPEGLVEPIGRHLAEMALFMRSNSGPNCLISGGEGTVKLAPPEERGLGGRNQQTVLAALIQLSHSDPRGIVILSGGTDGEDGPTDAAGALVDAAIIDDAKRRGLQPIDFLNCNDCISLFRAARRFDQNRADEYECLRPARRPRRSGMIHHGDTEARSGPNAGSRTLDIRILKDCLREFRQEFSHHFRCRTASNACSVSPCLRSLYEASATKNRRRYGRRFYPKRPAGR